MPLSGSSDIPHVTVHDHYIRRPVSIGEINKMRQFIGLQSVNEKDPDLLTRAKAYLAQYEKFTQEPMYLDSARLLLAKLSPGPEKNETTIHLLYATHDFGGLIAFLKTIKEPEVKRLADKKSLDNRAAWTAYRIAEAYTSIQELNSAEKWLVTACDLAPLQMDFRNKKAAVLAMQNKLENAVKEYQFILSEQPRHVQALVSLGYLCMLQSQFSEALRLYGQAYQLEPDNQTLLLNLAAYYLYKKNASKAKDYLNQLLKRNPAHKQANLILKQLADRNG